MKTNNSKLRAVGYTRVSSKDQVDGYSLDFQREAIEKYCLDKYNLIKIYTEEGVSGKTVSKRDSFQQMCSDGYAGKFEVVIVWKFDRFTRDIETGVASFFGLKNHDIKIISLHEGITSDSDNMMTLLSIGMADKYRKDLIVNIKRGTRTKLRSGDPRIGKAGQPIARYWDENKKLFRVIPEEAAEWKQVVKQYLEGVSAAEIGRQSKERSSKVIPTTDVNVRNGLRRGLGNKHIITYDGEVFEFACERIVSERTEKAIHRLMDSRKYAPNIKPEKFLLSGHIYCADCGRRLTSLSRTEKSHRRYIHQERNGCSGIKTIRVDYIDQAVLKECFVVFGGDKKSFEEAIKEHLPNEKARKEVEIEITNLKRQLTKYEREKQLILDKVLDPKQTLNPSIIDGLNQRAEQIENNAKQTRDDLQQKERHLSSMMTVNEYKETAEKIYAFWKRVYSGWDAMEEMNWKNKKYLIDLMFDGIDEEGRPFGVYVKNIGGKVFDYEIYGRFSVGSRFMKEDNFDYFGKETEAIEKEWDRKFQSEKAAYRKNKSSGLKMGDTGFEPVTSRV